MPSSQPPLIDAVERLDVESVQRLLAQSTTDVNARDSQIPLFDTALHKACQFGHEEIVKLLLDNGADVLIRNGEGITPTQVCCEIGNEDRSPILALILDKHPNLLNEPLNTYSDEQTLLHYACFYQNSRMVQMLVEKGADCLAEDYMKMNVLHYACQYANESGSLVKHILDGFCTTPALLEKCLLSRDREGRTPLHIADRYEVIRSLLERPFQWEETKWITNEMIYAKSHNGVGATRISYFGDEGLPSGIEYYDSLSQDPMAVAADCEKGDLKKARKLRERSLASKEANEADKAHDEQNDASRVETSTSIGRQLYQTCVKLNPDLTEVQRQWAQETFLLLRLKFPQNEIIYQILGFLKVGDTMKRTRINALPDSKKRRHVDMIPH